eukprot:COSAG03_NODE_27096_length_255_cov_0.666667_1_plen_61_part_10
MVNRRILAQYGRDHWGRISRGRKRRGDYRSDLKVLDWKIPTAVLLLEYRDYSSTTVNSTRS